MSAVSLIDFILKNEPHLGASLKDGFLILTEVPESDAGFTIPVERDPMCIYKNLDWKDINVVGLASQLRDLEGLVRDDDYISAKYWISEIKKVTDISGKYRGFLDLVMDFTVYSHGQPVATLNAFEVQGHTFHHDMPFLYSDSFL